MLILNLVIKQMFGIILNELLTNVFKYAFKDVEDGKVFISIEKLENRLTLIIHDNGIGIDQRIESQGLGMSLVNMLVEQLQGSYHISNENGTKNIIQLEL